jgi:hypothetical protein
MENDDADAVRSVAQDYVNRLGKDAAPYLRAEEAASKRANDGLSAEAWHDIGDAAERILSRLILSRSN